MFRQCCSALHIAIVAVVSRIMATLAQVLLVRVYACLQLSEACVCYVAIGPPEPINTPLLICLKAYPKHLLPPSDCHPSGRFLWGVILTFWPMTEAIVVLRRRSTAFEPVAIAGF
ncbi:hypothetical protein LX36DRAFT_358426 [Colletotrichum falcatum]|nr:hypothetical protein LX36DRAFT_358426 [Colletotrichum falcatum]